MMDKHMFYVPRIFRCWLIAGLLLFAQIGFAQDLEMKPDLEALPAADLDVVPDFGGGSKLIFGTTTWNSGEGPLILIGGKKKGRSGGQKVYQRIERTDGSFYDLLAGTFMWHPGHQHFHFEDYALYTLKPVNAPGQSQRTSAKTTFCVVDTDHVDPNLGNANPVYAFCGVDVQGMSVGWGDTYRNQLSGQSISLTGLDSGYYELVIEVDPKNRVVEIGDPDDPNNVACSLLYLDITRSTVAEDPAGC